MLISHTMKNYLNKQILCSSRFIACFIACFMLAMAGCSSKVISHGNHLDPIKLAKIEPGKTRLIEVEALFGKPSVSGAFDSGKIYYVAQVMEQKPGGIKQTTSRTLVAFTYDENNIITAIDITDEQSGRNVFHHSDKTLTPGDTFGVVEQIFRNVQRRAGR